MTDFLQDHPDGHIIALDEMSPYFQVTTTRVWSLIGQTPLVRVSPQRDYIHYCGAVNLRTGHEFVLPIPEQIGAIPGRSIAVLSLSTPALCCGIELHGTKVQQSKHSWTTIYVSKRSFFRLRVPT